MKSSNAKKRKHVSYTKWGYIFLIPFFLVYFIFSFIPMISTFYYSFFENYMSGLNVIGPKFVGFDNFVKLFTEADLLKYTENTLIMWVLGFVPQIAVSLLLAAWFTNTRLKLRCSGFFKTVIYMPNLIMASAFSMLFFTLFSNNGPINMLLMDAGIFKEPCHFMSITLGARSLIASMNFLMWFGNTTILLMAGMMGIDVALFEAAEVDGATSFQVFSKITMPLLKPIMAYVMITSLIGGLQMFDLPQILTNGKGGPDRTTMTLIMYLNNHLFSKNYGMAGALSVVIFIITGALSIVVFKLLTDQKEAR
ncbi:carbohydrate ABC transporter permease [Anaeromicropila herbilytica]|uniref:Lactose ABC transporter permease n=1 Tax=Anaeromicropila herbilytica TaxID=2785025 RepID=A0A7R7IBY1_9FIRM|nr:sugar ABC transporter permease [Anaeromicropila herbilytica]BCN29271.1 lactose ABC transporter permease [Anaeromicropila herbilytica]